jgi:hypothetical protein
MFTCTQACLISLNNVVHMSPNAVGAALVEHGTVEAVLRLLKRASGALLHPLAPIVVLVLHALCVNLEDLYGHVDAMAVKTDLVELVVGAVIWLGWVEEVIGAVTWFGSHKLEPKCSHSTKRCFAVTLASTTVAFTYHDTT